MTKARSITIETTDTINDVIGGLPDHVAEMFLTSMLEMACIMVQTGDITVEIIGDKTFKITARKRSRVRRLTVNLVP